MPPKARKAFLTTASIALLATMANAQAPTGGAPAQGPYRPFAGADRPPAEGPRPIELTQTPPTAYRQSLSMTDSTTLASALAAARVETIGRDGEPLLILDTAVDQPERLVEIAARDAGFQDPPPGENFYPGRRAPAPRRTSSRSSSSLRRTKLSPPRRA